MICGHRQHSISREIGGDVPMKQASLGAPWTAARSHRPSQASKYSCVQLGRRLGDQVADQNNITPDRDLGDRNGARHREVVQSDQGLWIIQPQAGGKDVFVHISAVERAGLSTLNEGQQIEYEIEENRGKTSAVNLKVK